MTYCNEVIISDDFTVGNGKGPESPFRRVTKVFKKDGAIIAEHDPCGNFTLEDLYKLQIFLSKNIGTIEDFVKQLNRF